MKELLFTESLKKNFEFRVVYNKGRSLANSYLVLYALKNGLGKNRLGISISKKVGNSVVRSRKVRLIRENYRLMEPSISKGYDIVFIARINAKNADFYDIKKSMEKLFKRIALYKEPDC